MVLNDKTGEGLGTANSAISDMIVDISVARDSSVVVGGGESGSARREL